MNAPRNKEINPIKIFINPYPDEKKLKVCLLLEKYKLNVCNVSKILYRIITLRPTISYVTFKITIVLCWLNY